MNNEVRYAREGRTGVITVNFPPVNALSVAVRAGLLEALEAGLEDADAEALVLTTAGRTFIAGADIREFGKPPQSPNLGDVIARFEASPKPVVAALHGTALGGGLELALGCAFRVALPGTKLGLPEVKLGLLPGAGGTQRLPRLAGVRKALEMITSGDPVDAAEALELGIIDAVMDAPSALEAGLHFARQVLAEKRPVRPARERSERIAGTDPTLFAAFREELGARVRNLFSPFRCVDAVEAACTLPFEDGLKRERALFLECMASPQRAGLIHAFLGEREVAKVPGLPAGTPIRPLRSVAVIGAGTMGGGIAMCFANIGIPVTLLDSGREALDKSEAAIRRAYEGMIRKDRLTSVEMDSRLTLIRPALSGQADSEQALAEADVIVEAVFEDLAVKREIFARLDAVCKPGAILATNTSTLDVNAIAAATHRPQDVVGLHFFSPANVMRLLEVVRAEHTADDVLATAMALAKRIGKVGVPVGVCYGFVGNRMLHQRGREAIALVDEGASPQHVDAVLTGFGFPMGPFAMNDLAGLDVGWRIREERRKAGDSDSLPVTWLDRLAEGGRFGQKTGAGVYRYEPGGHTPLPDPAVEALVEEHRHARGITPRPVSDQEIQERCLYAMVNEGARILEEGIAARPLDIDMIWIHGYGFPAYRGGPMFWADQVGLPGILEAVRGFHDRLGGTHWRPAPLLERLAAEGRGFRDL